MKSQSPYTVGGGGFPLPTFDAESKSAEIPNSLYGGVGGVRRMPCPGPEPAEPTSCPGPAQGRVMSCSGPAQEGEGRGYPDQVTSPT